MSNYFASIILFFALFPLLANISAPKVFIRIPQPKTNVNWYEYVKSYPPWAKNLEVELGLGKTLVTFTGTYIYYTLDVVYRQISTFLEDSVAIVYELRGL